MKQNIFKCLIGTVVIIGLWYVKQFFVNVPELIIANNSPNKAALFNDYKLASHLDKEWHLIWQDNFIESNLNRSKWTTEHGQFDKNNEMQVYHPEQVVVDQEYLKIITTEEFKSGAIHTMDKFSFLYGRVEMRARLPKGKGIFPAFWMMPNIEQTWLPEIDILELLGHEPDRAWMVVHWLENGILKSDSTSFKGPDFSTDFHIFTLEWSEDQLTWFIDGEQRFETDAYVPDVPMYLYLNTAVGGDWPGAPDHSTDFPQVFEIDYVRVYQRTEDI